MKKIISLVVVATMLFTLFAVNVSAAVLTGTVTTEIVPTEDFSGDVGSSWTTPYKTHTTKALPMDVAVKEDGDNSVLSLIPTADGDDTNMTGVGIGEVAYPDAYEVSVRLKKAGTKQAGIVIWIGDTTLDAVGGKNIAIAGANFDYGDWYECRIKVANQKIASVEIRNITDGGEWTALAAKWSWMAAGEYRNLDNCSSKMGLGVGYWGYSLCADDTTPGAWAEGIEYYVDDVAITVSKTIPSTGVYYSKNFEDDSTLTVRHGMGTVDAGKESNGNTYGVLKTNASGSMNIISVAENTIKGVNTKDCWVLEFDVCAKNDGAALTVQVSGTAESGGSMYTLKNLPKDTWYTYKITYDGNKVAGTPSGRFIEKAVRGTNSWEFVSVFGADAAFTDYEGSGATETILFMNGNTTVSEFWIDNITLSALEAVSLPAVSVADNTLSITANFSDVNALYNSPATMTAVLATFAGDVLVDVDFEAVANNAGTIAADLEASVAGADKAELYVWDGIGTAKPVLGTVYPLTSYLQ